MKRQHEELAALAAGRELSESQQRQWDTVSANDAEAESLSEALTRQREALLLLRDEASSQGDVMRTQVLLREEIRKERSRFGVWRPRWTVAGGMALATLALVVAGTLAVWPEPQSVEGPVVAAAYPEPPVGWIVAKRMEAPPRAAPAKIASQGPVLVRAENRDVGGDSGAPSQTPPLRTASIKVTEVLEQADGSTRLRLQTRNPAVVIYLVEGRPQQTESGGE